jgi:hypothetical protein
MTDAFNESIAILTDMGITLPTPAYIVGVLVFGIIGMMLFWKGRQLKKAKVKWIGLALMLYPYVVWGTVPIYVVGLSLCVAAWWYWRR